MQARVSVSARVRASLESSAAAREAVPTRPAVQRLLTIGGSAALFALLAALPAAAQNVKLRPVVAVQSEVSGPPRAVAAFASARAVSAVSADFDRNGTPDVLFGYATASGGVLVFQRGNPDAFAPTDDSVFARLHQGYEPDSLLPAATVVEVPEAPDFLVAGSFGGVGEGVLMAGRGGALHLLQATADGGFALPRRIALPGPVTALASGEFRAPDGYTDLAVGVATPAGSALLIFDDAREGFATPLLELPVADPVAAIEFGSLDEDGFRDVAFAAGRELTVLHGWSRARAEKAAGRQEQVTLDAAIVGLALGEFVWDRTGRSEIATLSVDGAVQVVRAADADLRPFTAAEAALRHRGVPRPVPQIVRDLDAAPDWNAKRAGGWVAAHAFASGVPIAKLHATAQPILRANLSYREADDLMIVGARGLEVVHEVAKLRLGEAAPAKVALKRTPLLADAAPAAVLALPKKLDGVRDFVVLDARRIEPIVVPQAPNTTITVDRTDDPSGAGLTAASACTAAGNDCSLRGAFQFANTPGNENTTINLPGNNTYILSINGTIAGGCDGNTVGDLGANATVTLTGGGAANTVIRQTGTGPANDGDRIMCMNEPFTLNLIYSYSGITFVGGRDGTAAGTGTALGGGGIIGGEQGNSLTLTNVVFANNQVTVLGSANIGGGGVQITGGHLVITNSTFGGSSGPGGYADRSSTTSANHQAGSGGGVMFTPSAPAHMGGTGNLTVTGSTFTRNTTGSICCGGSGMDLAIFAFASPGGIGNGVATIGTSTFSNNQSLGGNGGAVDVESLPTVVNSGTFTNNSAVNRGGAFYVGGGSLHLNGSGPGITMTGNTATQGGTSVSTVAPVNVSGSGTTLGGSIEINQFGHWTMNAGSSMTPTDVSINGGIFTGNNATVNIQGNLSIGPNNIVGSTFNANSSTINIAGNFSHTGGGSSPATTFSAGSGTFNFNGTGSQTISNNTVLAFFNLTDSNTSQPLTLANSLAVNGTLNVNGANAILAPAPGTIVSGTGTLTGTGTARATRTDPTADFLSQYTISNKTFTNLTIDYNGAGAQTVNSAPAYSNLRISGSGTKTLQGNTSVSAGVNIAAATLAGSTFNLGLGGNWTNSATFSPGTGTVTFNGSSGTQTLAGNTTFHNLTLAGAATTNFGSSTFTIGNDLSATAGTMDAGTSTLVFTGTTDNAGALTGAALKNVHHLQINSPATLTHAAGGNLTIKGNFTNAGTFAQGAGLTTSFQNNASPHLLAGAGTTTFGSMTVDAANAVNAGSHSFNAIGPAFTVNGSFSGGTGTVRFNGAVAQTLGGSGTKTFGALLVDNAAGVQLADGGGPVDASVSGVLTLTTDLMVASGAVLQQDGTSTGAADVVGTVRRVDVFNGVARSFGNLANSVTNAGGLPVQLDVNLAKSVPAAFPSSTRVVPRAYTLTPSGGGVGTLDATVRLRYLDAELAGPGITENRLVLWRNDGSAWSPRGGTVDASNNHVTLSGVTALSPWAIAEGSDLTLSKSNSLGGTAVVGQPWDWVVRVANAGSPATFSAGQTIFTDELPTAGMAYGPVVVANPSNIDGSANLQCAIASGTLSCSAVGGSVTFRSDLGNSRFDAVFPATSQVAAMQQNPRSGGSATVDPGSVVVESNESNNASNVDTVNVGKAATTTAITEHLPDPTVAGFAATVKWNVSVNAPGALGAVLSGTVQVSAGADSCSAPVGDLQCDITFTSGGNKSLVATYGGDANYLGSMSAGTPHVVTFNAPTIAKAFQPATIVSGDSTTVTLTLSNSNGLALSGAAFSDTLSNMATVGGAVGGTCVGTTPNMLLAGATALSFGGIAIPAQGSCTVEFPVTTTTAGVLPNTTSGVTTGQTPVAGPASNTANLTVTPRADLSITKTDNAAMAVPGNPVTYTVVASNAGPNGASGATVNDTFPASLSGCTWTCTGAGGGTCTAAGSGHLADSANLPNGASVTYLATCTLSSNAAGSLVNTATVAAPAGVTDSATGNNSATDVDTLPPRDLTLTKVDDVGGAVVVGQSWTWTLTAANSGAPATFGAGQAILVDELPASGVGYGAPAVLNVSNVTGSANIACGIASSVLTCAAQGGSVTFDSNLGASSFQVAFTATAQAAGTVQNPRAGGVAAIDPGNAIDEDTEGNNTASSTVTVGKAATATAIASHLPEPSLAGLPVVVQWGVTVAGPGALGSALSGNVTVSDGTDSCMADVAAGQCSLSFSSGGSKTLVATYAGDANYQGSSSGGTMHTVNVEPPAIAKSFLPSSIASGGASTVTLTLSNANGIALSNASFGDTLTDMQAAGGAVSGTCTGTTPNTLANGDTALAFSAIALPPLGECTVVFAVTSSTLGTHPNTTTGVSTAQTPAAGTPSNTANLTVSPGADLSITNTDGSANATPGDTVTYTIVASNAGPSDVSGAPVTDTFPGVLSGCAWNCVAGSGDCTPTGFGNIEDSVDLADGGSVTYTATCTLSAAAVGPLSNTASVAVPAGVVDPDPSNNSATDVDTLPARPDLTLVKSHVGSFGQGNAARDYTIVVTNSGDAATDGSTIAVTDVVPAGLVPTGASGSGWNCGIVSQTMTCTRDSVLGAGTAAPAITLTVSVDDDAPALVVNTASVAGGGNPASGNDSADDPTTILAIRVFANGFEGN